jgi:Flp pilus assembly protein TadG
MVGEASAEGTMMEPPAERLPRLRAVLRCLHIEERGTAVVEFALVAPILFLLIFGIFDFGRALNYYNQETQLAGLGARAAAVNRDPADTGAATGQIIQTELAGTYAKGELQNKTTFCITPATAPKVGQPVTVTASYQFHFLPLIGVAVGSPTITITASQTERQEVTPTYTTGCAS